MLSGIGVFLSLDLRLSWRVVVTHQKLTLCRSASEIRVGNRGWKNRCFTPKGRLPIIKVYDGMTQMTLQLFNGKNIYYIINYYCVIKYLKNN